MKLVRIHQIATILLIIGFCEAKTSGRDLSNAQASGQESTSRIDDEFSQIDDTIDTYAEVDTPKEEVSEDNIPILPPIILLDFGNDTENENITSEEKSKRTVNSGIGYGIEKNSLQRGRYSYYFPGGKTGTTVSIEESISPFLPKTIVERIQPNNQGNTAGSRAYEGQYNLYNTGSSFAQSHSNFQYSSPQVASKSQQVFGLRTRLQKAPAITSINSNLESHQNYLPASKPSVGLYGIQNSGYRSNVVSSTTKSSPLAFSPTEPVRYITPSPLSYAGLRGNSFNHATPSPFPRHPTSMNTQTYSEQNIQSNTNSQGYNLHGENVESSTVRPFNYNSHLLRTAASSQVTTTPRYTIENGIRYENKIFWKYPDGRVSDVPPATYVETYSDYSHPAHQAHQAPKSQQSPHSIYEAGSMENGVFSQGPVQFPTTPESGGQRDRSPFVSTESLGGKLHQQQVYRLGYQNLLGHKTNLNLAQQETDDNGASTTYNYTPMALRYSARSKPKSGRKRVNYQPSYLHYQTSSKYMVDSPNPEYTDAHSTESSVNSTTPVSTNLFAASGELSTRITSKYTPRVRNYLRTIFPAGDESKRQRGSDKSQGGYPNLEYSDLLNYHPSISQYIKNPASILNVHPTFVQAGNSLIPVIILKVDGAMPIQPKVAPNINLKALLQQYLVQYANSVQEMARSSNYDLGAEQQENDQNSAANRSPILDLIKLTQSDARSTATYDSNSYVGRSSYDTSNLETPKSYVNNGNYGQRSPVRQKVKNVQILNDPRIMNYEVNN